MYSPSHNENDVDDDEERIRRFLNEDGSPLKKVKKKVKWDLIHDSLGSPQKDDSIGLFKDVNIVEKNFVNAIPTSTDGGKKTNGRSEYKRIKGVHPGLNVFPNDPFMYFTSKDLDLEKDLGYKGRDLFESTYGGSFDDLKKNPLEFVLLLCPESKSVLISNDNDFKAICDYLYYSLSSTDSELEFSVFTKALGDLCFNYKTKWSINYKSILTTYVNLGCDISVLSNRDVVKRMIKSRLEIVARIKELKKVEKCSTEEYSCSKSNIFPKFILLKSSGIDKKYFTPFKANNSRKTNSNDCDQECESMVELKYDRLIRYTKFLSAFIAQHKDRICFIGLNDDWTGLLILTYFLALMASDKGFTQNESDIWFDVQRILNTLIEMFSPRQWSGGSAGYGSEMSALCDMAKVFLYLGLCTTPKLKTWDPRCLPEVECFKQELDHHHNILFRVSSLIPPSPRGRELLKATSFLSLQFLLNEDREIVFEPSITVIHLEEFLRDTTIRDRISNYFVHEQYLSWTLIRIMDLIIGNEPVLDFSKELMPSVNQVSSFLGSCIRKLKDDIFDTNPSYLKEVVNQLLCKWNLFSLSSSKAVNAKITDFIVTKRS